MMADSKSLAFGRYLMAKRLEKGISLKSVSETTRIGIDTLGFIENEDHSKLPAAVFVKGFLRAYAKAIGADGEKAVRFYLKSVDVFQVASIFEDELVKFRETFWRRMLASLGLLLCIIVFTVYVDHLLYSPMPAEQLEIQQREKVISQGNHQADGSADKRSEQRDPDTLQKELLPGEEAIEIRTTVHETGEKEPEPAAPLSSEAVLNLPTNGGESPRKEVNGSQESPQSRRIDAPKNLEVSGKLNLEIITIEKTWLKITVDDHDPKEYLLEPADRLKFQAISGYNLFIGNASGIKLYLNGNSIEVPGKKGHVVRLQIP